MADQEQQGNIRQEYNNATGGLNQDQSPNQIAKGKLTYALNAAVENFNDTSISYQNEVGTEFCLSFPEGFSLIGNHFISEKNKHIFFLTNPETGDCQIGYMDNNDCEYRIYVDDSCLRWDVNHPIHKIFHKITNCTTELYWADNVARRYIDLDNIPYILAYGSGLCDPKYSNRIDCNQLKIQPDFSIPQLEVSDVVDNSGNLISGAYQFAVQYSDANSNPYTSYYSVTNPTPIADIHVTNVNFNYPVGKSIIIQVSRLDITGKFQYFNLAVIKTINGASNVELVGTYFIDDIEKKITYTGQGTEAIHLSINDIFEKYPYYDIADDLTAVQDILVWDNLTYIDRINYQSIASGITLQWETWRIPATENYSNESNATNLRGYLRDEVYAFEIVFLLKNGKQTDGFHIPGRIRNSSENRPDVADTDNDFIGAPDYITGGVGYSPYWKIYNTASVTGFSNTYSPDPTYKGTYQYGEFAYWESTEQYPCNKELWGELADKNIRHHKFPDVLVSPTVESKLFSSPGLMVMGNDAVFPIGVKVDVQQINSLISTSNLSNEQKSDIAGYKIVRGDRSTNKSIVAKGILRNVGKYTREEQDFYYPNYPYNDLNIDPFLNQTNNAYAQICQVWDITITNLNIDPLGGLPYADVEYTDCNINKQATKRFYSTDPQVFEWCSITRPVILYSASGTVGIATYEIWYVYNNTPGYSLGIGWVHPIYGYKEFLLTPGMRITIDVVEGTGGPVQTGGGASFHHILQSIHTPTTSCNISPPISSIRDDSNLAYRQVFNSPETSFGQPFLGGILKLESVMFGKGSAHFVEVKNNAKYKLITEEVQRKALKSSDDIALSTSPYNYSAMFLAYQSYLTIYINGITRKNFAYSFNSIADYNYINEIPNDMGIKQRNLDIKRYLIPGVHSVGDIDTITHHDVIINNYQRESSIFLKTDVNKTALPFPDKTPSIIPGGVSLVTEFSRYTISEIGNCSTPAKENPIETISYYASLKNQVSNQWGQLYSYETIDTGFQSFIGESTSSTMFGGDTFISRFAFKTKLPFFIDNRVDAPDDSDIFYDEIGNVAYPKYWHSARSILKDYASSGGLLSNIISYKAHNFDCPNDNLSTSGLTTSTTSTSTTTTSTTNAAFNELLENLTYYDGYFYLFAYGVPNFYCESSYNTDLRQAYNDREGDFWPHVSTSIPDDWEQEHFVSIANDNSYYYNTTFSKQNKENTFSHLPPDWKTACYTYFPFRTIYSDPQEEDPSNRVNNWLVYSPLSYFDFPKNYGNLVSLDSLQNRAILARFENKSLIYNNLLTVDTSNPQMAYLGNPGLFKGAPPIDFADTDLGYVGSQHKFLLKIPQGQVTIDAKRGQIFLISGTQSVDLSAFGSGMNRFFTDHLAFEILRYFPEVDVDNAFKDIGLHGVYDSKFDRIIITKLDYIPLNKDIVYNPYDHNFYLNTQVACTHILQTQVYLTDTEYFCNKSWTISYNMNTRSWISFHSYIPNWYIAENNYFYSGINGCCEEFDVSVELCTIDVRILNEFPTTSTTTTYIGTTTTTTSTLAPSCTTLGRASNFAVLGASTITNTGSSIITGDLGLYPGTSVTGFPPGIVYGTQHITDSSADNAKIDATAAYNCLSILSSPTRLGADIGGTTVTAGVYDFSSSAAITGTLTLNGGGNSNAVFVFIIPSTLITATSAIVLLINEANPCNVYWLVGSSATIGISTTMIGNIIAQQSITMNTSATLTGKAFALVAAVTLDTNVITNCECTINPCDTTSTTTTITPTTTSTTTVAETTTTSTTSDGETTTTTTTV